MDAFLGSKSDDERRPKTQDELMIENQTFAMFLADLDCLHVPKKCVYFEDDNFSDFEAQRK